MLIKTIFGGFSRAPHTHESRPDTLRLTFSRSDYDSPSIPYQNNHGPNMLIKLKLAPLLLSLNEYILTVTCNLPLLKLSLKALQECLSQILNLFMT